MRWEGIKLPYTQVEPGRAIYVRDGVEDELKKLAKLIFDFDGVLISVSKSYREAIRSTVDYYFLKILGLHGSPRRLVSREDVQKFKDTEKFNNDWTLSYALIQFYLGLGISMLDDEARLRLKEKIGNTSFPGLPRLIKDLTVVGSSLRAAKIDVRKLLSARRRYPLETFLSSVREQALPPKESIEASLNLAGAEGKTLIALAPYNEDGDDLVRRLLEEIYLGRTLFEKFYNEPAFFKIRRGLVENERPIAKRETLRWLRDKCSMGIYSERPRDQGLYAIEKHGLQEFFDSNYVMFFDDLADVARQLGQEPGRFGKPNPAGLLRLTEKLGGGVQGYVGDTVSDAALIRNARSSRLDQMVFFGTLSSSEDPDSLRSQFMEIGADVIVMDVNDIPEVVS